MDNDSQRSTIPHIRREISMNQQSYLLDCMMKFAPELQNDEEAKNKIWDYSEFLKEKAYKYLLHLFFTSKNEQGAEGDRKDATDRLRKELNSIIK